MKQFYLNVGCLNLREHNSGFSYSEISKLEFWILILNFLVFILHLNRSFFSFENGCWIEYCKNVIFISMCDTTVYRKSIIIFYILEPSIASECFKCSVSCNHQPDPLLQVLVHKFYQIGIKMNEIYIIIFVYPLQIIAQYFSNNFCNYKNTDCNNSFAFDLQFASCCKEYFSVANINNILV